MIRSPRASFLLRPPGANSDTSPIIPSFLVCFLEHISSLLPLSFALTSPSAFPQPFLWLPPLYCPSCFAFNITVKRCPLNSQWKVAITPTPDFLSFFLIEIPDIYTRGEQTFKIADQRQYHIFGNTAKISATISDLKDARVVILKYPLFSYKFFAKNKWILKNDGGL